MSAIFQGREYQVTYLYSCENAYVSIFQGQKYQITLRSAIFEGRGYQVTHLYSGKNTYVSIKISDYVEVSNFEGEGVPGYTLVQWQKRLRQHKDIRLC